MTRGYMTMAAAGLLAAAAQAEIHVVQADGTGDFPTIQAAMDAAVDGDIIELGDGTFQGDGNRAIVFDDKSVTVRSQSGDAASCIIDCDGWFGFAPGGLFQFSTASVENLTVIDAGDMGGESGAIRAVVTHLAVRGCVLSSAASIAISQDGGTLLVEDCVIVGNNAGVGVDLVEATIRQSTIANNGGGIGAGEFGHYDVERSIIWGNCDHDIEMSEFGGSLEVHCSIYGTLDPGMAGVLIGPDNLQVDPQFCDPVPCKDAPTTAGDYTLRASSMALPGSSPCGALIGALGEGCEGSVPVLDATWSSIKDAYGR